jgi:hypothetical protein
MIRSLVLFTHVVGVLALFAALVVEWLGINGLRRSMTHAEGMAWVRLNASLRQPFGIAFAVTVLSGGFLGDQIGALGSDWLLATYGALLLIGLSWGLMARPVSQALRQAVTTPNDVTLTAAQASASAWPPRASLHVRIALTLAIVYLMIAKPGAGMATAAVGFALAFAVVATPRRRPTAPTLVEERQ